MMSSTCGACNTSCDSEGSKSVVKCSGGCEKLFHISCVKEDGDIRLLRSAKDFKCKDCKTPSVQGSCSSASSKSELTKQFLVSVLDQLKKEVFEEINIVKGDVGKLTDSAKFSSDKLDDSKKLLEDLKAQLTALRKENEKLRAENSKLSSEVSDMKTRVRSLEQYTRKNNIEISGVPVTKGENATDIVKDVGAALGLEVRENEVSAAHRIPSFNRERLPSIVVQFVSRGTKDSWLLKFKEAKGLTANQVNPTFPVQRVYVNEHLSPDNKVFLSKLKKKCKEIGYTYVWCRDGKFFVRKSQGDRSLRVDSYEQMDSLR